MIDRTSTSWLGAPPPDAHETAREIDRQTGGSRRLSRQERRVNGRHAPRRHGLDRRLDRVEEERRFFNGATCARDASAATLARQVALRRPAPAWITNTRHGVNLWRHGALVVRGRAPGARSCSGPAGRSGGWSAPGRPLDRLMADAAVPARGTFRGALTPRSPVPACSRLASREHPRSCSPPVRRPSLRPCAPADRGAQPRPAYRVTARSSDGRSGRSGTGHGPGVVRARATARVRLEAVRTGPRSERSSGRPRSGSRPGGHWSPGRPSRRRRSGAT